MLPLFGFFGGLVFGLGLVISGMTDPAKILNFLDFFGAWDASLAFVMCGAVVVTFLGYRFAWRRRRPVMMERFDMPSSKHVDRPLLLGAALFGIGWGIGGYCPGPALAALALMAPGTLVFVPAMLVGMWAGARIRDANVLSPSQKGATA
jgi:uncharacterized membrane protein YedE/YeeE